MSEQEMRLVDRRCSSCEHEWRFHQTDGCWYSVTLGRKGRDSGCPCAQPRPNRVPQPGDRVLGWAGRPFGTVHGFVVADEITNAAGFIAVKAPAVATPYAVDAASVEVIEPAPATEQPSEWRPTPGERVTGQLPDGTPLTGVLTDGGFSAGFPGSYCHLDMGGGNYAWVLSATLRPADTGKETDR